MGPSGAERQWPHADPARLLPEEKTCFLGMSWGRAWASGRHPCAWWQGWFSMGCKSPEIPNAPPPAYFCQRNLVFPLSTEHGALTPRRASPPQLLARGFPGSETHSRRGHGPASHEAHRACFLATRLPPGRTCSVGSMLWGRTHGSIRLRLPSH